MNIKYVAVIVALCLAVVFLGLDKCGSSKKADELKGEWKKASEIAEVERMIKEEIIKEQQEKIETLDATIEVLNTTIAEKDKDLATIEDELGELKQDFESLEECQAQYNKLVEGFNLAKSIIKELGKPIEYYDKHGNKKFRYPEGSVTFKLNEKYERQVIISLEYKGMDETSRKLLDISNNRVKELEKISKRLRLTSSLKSGLAVILAGLIVYNVVK